MLITPTNEPPLDPTNIISSFLRTLRGKLTPPDLTQIHPTGFRFPPSSTTHRFTVQSRPRMTWSPSKGSQRLWGTMWLCFTQRFNALRFKDRHHVARIRQDSVGRQNGITHSTESFREVILSPWGYSPLFMIPDLTDRINLVRLLLATNWLQPLFVIRMSYFCCLKYPSASR